MTEPRPDSSRAARLVTGSVSVVASVLAGVLLGFVLHYVLYRIGLPSEPFIYVAF